MVEKPGNFVVEKQEPVQEWSVEGHYPLVLVLVVLMPSTRGHRCPCSYLVVV
jgi:hypothetical protein